jgi:hypothetical protein
MTEDHMTTTKEQPKVDAASLATAETEPSGNHAKPASSPKAKTEKKTPEKKGTPGYHVYIHTK